MTCFYVRKRSLRKEVGRKGQRAVPEAFESTLARIPQRARATRSRVSFLSPEDSE